MILPAVIQAAVKMTQEPPVGRTAWLLLLYAIINVLAVGFNFLPSFEWYVWMPFALWLNYLLLRRQTIPKDGARLS
jgi:hypothetical protein